jgi:hypothetical protein
MKKITVAAAGYNLIMHICFTLHVYFSYIIAAAAAAAAARSEL